MTTTRVRKPAPKKTPILRTEYVKIADLQMYHKNPRIGNVAKIAESLEKSEQYRAIVVNVGTKTKRKNEILAGNHTYLAARRLGWTEILAHIVDVDDTQAAVIVVADNKTSDSGEIDQAIMAEVLAGLPDLSGTGFDEKEFTDIIKTVRADTKLDTASLDDILAKMPTAMGDEVRKDRKTEILESETDEQKDVARNRGAARPVEDKEIEEFEDVQSQLQGMLQLKEDMDFPGENFWQIADLRSDMLVEELPSPLKCWGGNEATPDDGKTWFFWNYGLGGVKGLPFDRSILAFMTHDEKFERWWDLPAYYTAKMLNSGITMAVVPDFSFYNTMTRALHLINVHKAQWLGRYFQEAGIKVIPRIQFDDEKSLEFCTLGIPKQAPVVACSIQNIASGDGTDEQRTKDEDEKLVAFLIRKCVEDIDCQSLLLYGAPKRVERIYDMSRVGVPMTFVENYAGVRRGVAFDNPDGIEGEKRKRRIARKSSSSETT